MSLSIAPVEPEPANRTTWSRWSRADGVGDDPPGVLAEAGRLEAGPRRLGVGVAVQREDRLADEVLDERERAPGGRVVGVGHAAQAERPDDGLVVADDARADRVDQRRGVGRQRAPHSCMAAILRRGRDPKSS